MHKLAFGQAGMGERGGGGDNFCGRRTISASGLCPGGQNLRGDKICSDTGTRLINRMSGLVTGRPIE